MNSVKTLLLIISIIFILNPVPAKSHVSEDITLYSRPFEVSAFLEDNYVHVQAKPQIWNTGPAIKATNEFEIAFELEILNTSLNITHDDIIISQTLLGFDGIPHGLMIQNTFSTALVFSSPINEPFNGSNLFNATLSLHSVAPDSLTSIHEAVSGTKISIKNNETTVFLPSVPEDWGATTVISWNVQFLFLGLIVAVVLVVRIRRT